MKLTKMRMSLRRLLPIMFASFITTVLVSLMNTLSAEQELMRRNGGDKNGLISESAYPRSMAVGDQKGGSDGKRPKVNDQVVSDTQVQKSVHQGTKTPAHIPPPPTPRSDRSERMKKLREIAKATTGKQKGEQETERRWRKDDEVLVPIEPVDGQLPPKSAPDPDIVALRDKWHVDEFPEPDKACPNKTTLEEFYWKKYSMIDRTIYAFRKTWQKDDSWDLFFAQIGNCDMYRENSQVVQNLLDDMAVMPIKSVANLDSGTQVKITLTFENGKQAVFKPMRFGRNYETDPNHFYFTDFERHHAEIAAFHLDRLLGFRRAIPTVGRVLNISSDLEARSDGVIKYFYSPVKNRCFVGKCDYYCDTTHAICGEPDLKEGSVQVWLPGDEIAQRDYWRSPYKRTYSKREPYAPWQTDPTFCTWKVKNTPPFTKGRRLLDIVDLYIFDFIAGNQDRHHYESFTFFDRVPHSSYIVHLDNGRAFGSPHFDDLDTLAPLTQCCIIRPSTTKTLLNFYLGPSSLAQQLKASLRRDPTYPVLARKYLVAIDRRVEIVLREVAKCIRHANGDLKKVLLNHFYNRDAPADAKEFEDSDSQE